MSMSITTTAYILMAVATVLAIVMFGYLKISGRLDGKAFAYGVLGTIVLQLLAGFIIFTNNIMYLIIDGLFLGTMYYNVVSFYGIRKMHMEEDEKVFRSFYTGLTIIGILIQVFLLGVTGLLVNYMSSDAEMIAYFGQDVLDGLVTSWNSSIFDCYYVTLCAIISEVLISYMVLRMFAYGAKNKVIRTAMKGELLMVTYYIATIFTPADLKQRIIACVVYGALVLATYFMYQNSKNDHPAIHVEIQ